MRLHLKVIAAALSAAIVVSAIPAPAAAQQNQPRQSILPTALSPIGAAWLFPATNTFHWTTSKYFWIKIPVKKPMVQTFSFQKPKYKWVKIKKVKHHSRTSTNVGKAVVGCIFGSALGAITAAVRKGNAMGNPLRWRSQAEHEKIVASGYEKQFELTSEEAHLATAFCGLGSFALNWNQAPAAVQTKY
jgi:hypothetical protein